MSKVKYRVREFTPNENQQGSHSFYAEVVINNDISNAELAQKIASRTGFKAYECQGVIAAIADIVSEEVLESNRISLANEQGTKLVNIYPKVTGCISDKDVQDNPEKYNNAQVATEEMLTPDMLTWSLGATVGVKFSKQFAISKQAQKVKTTTTEVNENNEGESSEDNGNTPPPEGGGFGG
jgi:hypothetical protein